MPMYQRNLIVVCLKSFWDLESLSIQEGEADIYQWFQKQISFKNGRYEVGLPWKEVHSVLPTHYELSLKRLIGLLRRLGESPGIQYDAVIKKQLRKGIIEVVKNFRHLTQVPITQDCSDG